MPTPPTHRDVRLMRYLGATGLLGGLPALGQIQYTDVQPDSVAVKDGLGLFFDLDQDGTEDFGVELFATTSYGINIDAAVVSAIDLYGGSGAAGQYVVTYAYSGYTSGTYAAAKLNAGVAVNSALDFEAELPMGARFAGTPIGFPWEGGATDGFLGLRLDVNGATHYGWARLDLSSDLDTVVLKDFAINLTPNAPISTGQTMSLVEDFERALSLNRSGNVVTLELRDPAINGTFEIMEPSGKLVSTGTLNPGLHQIGLPSSGVYLIRLNTPELVWTKKL
ncbi:hypothetical protein GC167_08965 [bacterium]|nr:hypothetical protein [bacterium]